MEQLSLSVLIVEDNSAMAANIYDYLEACGHIPDAAPDGRTALALLQQHRYDAIVLDWLMPRMDGLTMLQQLRQSLKSPTPVIMLTAKDQLEHKLAGFTAGADDYLVKPAALPELEMRLRVLVARRRSAGSSQRLEVSDLSFDTETLVIRRGERVLALSPIRRKLLESLMRAAPHVVSRQHLESLIWGDAPPDGDILRSHLHLLRKTVDAAGEPRLIHTVAGVGYRMGTGDEL